MRTYWVKDVIGIIMFFFKLINYTFFKRIWEMALPSNLSIIFHHQDKFTFQSASSYYMYKIILWTTSGKLHQIKRSDTDIKFDTKWLFLFFSNSFLFLLFYVKNNNMIQHANQKYKKNKIKNCPITYLSSENCCNLWWITSRVLHLLLFTGQSREK